MTSSTISRWLKCVLKLSGIDIARFKSHSIHGVAASKAKASGLSILEILKVAGWPSDKTFAEFNNKSIQQPIQTALQGLVVQSIVSLTSLLRVISLTVLADSIYNILIFFAEKM